MLQASLGIFCANRYLNLVQKMLRDRVDILGPLIDSSKTLDDAIISAGIYAVNICQIQALGA